MIVRPEAIGDANLLEPPITSDHLGLDIRLLKSGKEHCAKHGNRHDNDNHHQLHSREPA
jgi:hypothetical protein